jgi:steroid 5-alpha reductase family enzyme
VTLTGWRLRLLINLVRKGTLASIRSLDTRYAQVNQKSPFIARVKIASVKNG